MGVIGDLLYRAATEWKLLAGNTSTTRKYLGQTGTGSASAAPTLTQIAESEIAFTDITTNNASTSKHGYLKKLSNNASEFMDGQGNWNVPSGSGSGTVTHTGGALTANRLVIGAGTDDIAVLGSLGTTTTLLHGNAGGAPSYGAVVEGDLGLTDITTANVSTTKHGLAPKLPNDATKFLDGTGGYTVPSGSGAPTTAQYVTLATDGTLSNERVLTAGTGISLTDGGAGSTVTIAATGGVAGNWIKIRKGADETVNNSNTLQDDDDLHFAVAANSVYLIDLTMWLTSPNNTADWKMKFTGPSGFTMLWAPEGNSTGQPIFGGTATTGVPPTVNTESTTLSFGHNASGGPACAIHVRGWVETSASSGTLQVQWAQNTADASNSKVLKNSTLLYLDAT